MSFRSCNGKSVQNGIEEIIEQLGNLVGIFPEWGLWIPPPLTYFFGTINWVNQLCADLHFL